MPALSKEAVAGMSYKQLQAACRERELKASGKADELKGRLLAEMKKEEKKAAAEAKKAEAKAKKEEAKGATGAAGAAAAAGKEKAPEKVAEKEKDGAAEKAAAKEDDKKAEPKVGPKVEPKPEPKAEGGGDDGSEAGGDDALAAAAAAVGEAPPPAKRARAAAGMLTVYVRASDHPPVMVEVLPGASVKQLQDAAVIALKWRPSPAWSLSLSLAGRTLEDDDALLADVGFSAQVEVEAKLDLNINRGDVIEILEGMIKAGEGMVEDPEDGDCDPDPEAMWEGCAEQCEELLNEDNEEGHERIKVTAADLKSKFAGEWGGMVDMAHEAAIDFWADMEPDYDTG